MCCLLQWTNPEELYGIGKCEGLLAPFTYADVCPPPSMICMLSQRTLPLTTCMACADGADAYFMFCREEWRRVQPKDKDLLKCAGDVLCLQCGPLRA